jgi:hypothetical protein
MLIVVYDDDLGSNSEIIGRMNVFASQIPTEYKSFSFDKVDEFVLQKSKTE